MLQASIPELLVMFPTFSGKFSIFSAYTLESLEPLNLTSGSLRTNLVLLSAMRTVYATIS
jgi:hypothetical protein